MFVRFSRGVVRSLAVIAALSSPAVDSAAQAQPEPPAAPRTIVLVRHGAYVPDAADSSPGPGLSPLGVAQANLAAARLDAMGPWDALYASPMTRAQETAKVIDALIDEVRVATIPQIEECTPRTRRREIIEDEKPEKMAACEATLDRVFATHFVPARGKERREMFVCHGNVIRYLVTRALGVDTQAWLEMSVPHASITVIRVEADGRFKVISAGDIGHVPHHLQTGSTGMPERSLTVP